ncbi:MAG: hypothetical protein Tsb002_17840 [Wenzhouxiangellaceae bacterium]
MFPTAIKQVQSVHGPAAEDMDDYESDIFYRILTVTVKFGREYGAVYMAD